MDKYDITIIGAGPGGYVAAIYAAGRGKKVLLIEEDLVGGVCLNKGCIPTKALIELIGKMEYGAMIERKDEIIQRLRNGVETLLEARSVQVKKGHASFLDRGVIEIGSERVASEAVIISAGSHPIELGSFKFDGARIVSSDQMLMLKKVPKKLLVIGGGFIGCEFGYLYRSLGAEVTIVEMEDSLLPAMDKELAKNMAVILKKKKIKILTKTKADDSLAGSFDKILVSVGRRPNVESLGLDKAGIKTKDNRIPVDTFLQTNIKNAYAIGDVTGGKMLAHVASHEGIAACRNIIEGPRAMDYSAVPACVYTEPQIASVGLTKEEAQAKGYDVRVSKFPFSALGKAHAIDRTEGFVKMVGDEKSGIILGVHMVGPGVTDLVAEAALAVKLKMKAEDLAETMHAHPTLSESLMEAAFSFCGTPIHIL